MKTYAFGPNGTFTLTDPETGKDWSNHLWNDDGYILTVTHMGTTFSRYVNEKNEQVNVNCPYTGTLYVRDADSKCYWNISGYPSLNEITEYSCEHGQGYTRISSCAQTIEGSVCYAVAAHDTAEVWQVTLVNRDARERTLDVFATTVFDLNGYSQPVYYSAGSTSDTRFSQAANAVYCVLNNPFAPHRRCCGYISSSEALFSYDGNYEKFIGTMGTATKPRLLEKGGDCTHSLATVRCRGGVLQNRIVLRPGESKTLTYVTGLCDGKEELESGHAARMARAAACPAQAAADGVRKFGGLRTQCPEKRIENIMNYWAVKQVSYCTIGKKAVRDNAQLAMAILNFDGAFARKIVEECVAHQYADGHAVLTWYPYLEPNVYSDPSVWLILCVCEYVKETGDFDWLHTRVAYLDGGDDTVYGHLQRAAQWFMRADNFGAHGLPRIHHADWNDALNIPDPQAESVWLAMAICCAYRDLADLAAHCDDGEFAAVLQAERARLADTVNAAAYNGAYYVRAFSKFGTVGDKGDGNGGNIYVNPQVWAILAEIVPEDRLPRLLQSVDAMETECGIPLCAPPYATYDEHVGRMSGMLPGVYENGGIYNHAACFKIMADCMLGRADRAVATLEKVIPDGACNPSAVTTTEPYVFTNCYLKHPSVDMQVGFSWQTGTSAWALRAYYEGILGLVRTYDGLQIRPCIPASWQTVTAVRRYRGAELHITYDNKRRGSVRIFADGVPIEGNVLPPLCGKHSIRVEM